MKELEFAKYLIDEMIKMAPKIEPYSFNVRNEGIESFRANAIKARKLILKAVKKIENQ